MNHTPSLLLPQNNNGSYILLQNFSLKMQEIFITINFTSQPPSWEAPSPPGKAQGAGMCHSPHTTQGAAAELGTGADPSLPFCALTTRSSNVSQLFHLLTKPWLITASVSFPRQPHSCQGAAVTGSPKCFGKGGQSEARIPVLGEMSCPWHLLLSGVGSEVNEQISSLNPSMLQPSRAILQLCAHCSCHTHNTWKKLSWL